MEDVPQDVEGSLLSKRQVAVLKRRLQGQSYDAIAADLDSTPDGVRALEQNAQESIDAAFLTVRVARSLRSDVRIRADDGMRVLDVVRELRSAGDHVGVKLGGKEETLHAEVEDLLGPFLDGNRLTGDVVLTIDNDGNVGLVEPVES